MHSSLLRVLNLAMCVRIESEKEGREKQLFPVFWLQYPFQPLAINIIYCTFKLWQQVPLNLFLRFKQHIYSMLFSSAELALTSQN